MKKISFWNQERLKKCAELTSREYNIHHQEEPLKPTVLNLLVNDICNSRCQMCLIWKQKKDREFSPKELEVILSDTLFDKLRYIGVSGGEPTLRHDLPELFRVIVQKKNPPQGTGIITNAIQAEGVIEKIEKSFEICQAENVKFNIMVSLDGIGDIHDAIRGRQGNFENAVEVLRHFKRNTKIPISVGCTISKKNVWNVEDVLEYCQSEGVRSVFRVAEFIDRLYNKEQTEYIQNFSDIERYNLGLFFLKLEKQEKKLSRRQRTYQNIRKMLMEGAKRSSGCFWQSTAVSMDCRGNLLYCAPHSPLLGSCIERSAQALYEENIEKRDQILNMYCGDCIHDYAGEDTFNRWIEEERHDFWLEEFSNANIYHLTDGVDLNEIRNSLPLLPSPRKFLIIGWYGTETAGDKAILEELNFRLIEKDAHADITLASINPYYSEWTLREMGIKNIKIIPTFDSKFLRKIRTVDEVIMGGGPLMHIGALGFVLMAFYEAKKLGKRTRIAGCGIGPLHKSNMFPEIVRRILELSDKVELRDTDSAVWAKKMTGRDDIVVSGDYAIGFVKRWMKNHSKAKKTGYLNLYLRKWNSGYQGNLSKEEFIDIKHRFEKKLGAWIKYFCIQNDLKARLMPMHHLHIGFDDRDFNREFARKYLGGLEVIVEKQPVSVHQILTSMQESSISVCMRFHSVLFAETLDIPFIAIDYTHGGKISGYLNDQKKHNQMVTVKEIAEGKNISDLSSSLCLL